MNRIREATMGDSEFMIELIEIFLDDTPKQIEALRRAVEGRDAVEAARTAHRIKGSSGNIGAESLSDICTLAEKLGNSQDLDHLGQLVEQVDQEFARVADYLALVRSQPD